MSVLSSVFNKNKCCDIFMNIRKIVNDGDAKAGDGQEKIGPAVNHASYVHLKTLRVKKQNILMCLNLINKLRAVHGCIYLYSLIKREELVKQLFIMDVEEGGEILIPGEMSQDQLPRSFRYYDPILNIIMDNFSSERVDYFLLKN